MGSPNGGSSNNFSSFAGVITSLNDTNKKLRTLIDVLCSNKTGTTVETNTLGVTVLTFGPITNWDFNIHRTQAQVTLFGNTTLNISNMKAGQYYLLEVIQDGAGGHTITLPPGCKVVNNGGGILGLSAAPFSVDVVSLYYNGTTFYIMVNKSFT